MNSWTKIAASIAVLGCVGAVNAQSSGSTTVAPEPDPNYKQYSLTPWDNRSWYVTGSVNGLDPDDKFNSGNGEGLGLRFGKALSDHWDIQFGTTYDRDNDNGVNYHQNTLGADALYMFSRDRFKPFLLAGLGEQYDQTNDPNFGERSRYSPYVEAGLGFQYQIDDNWATQIDYRAKHIALGSSEFPFDKANDRVLGIGLTYYFGKPGLRPVTVAAAPAQIEPPPPPPPPPPSPASPPAPRFERVTLSSTDLFEFDSAQLRLPQDKLDQIAEALKQDPSVQDVQITGYTDRIGSAAYNLKLSQRRADAAKDYLVGRGVDPSRLRAVGMGKADPVVECHDKVMSNLIKCLEPNRRVVIDRVTVKKRVS